MNKSTWATYIETVYGASYVVASSSPQLLYHPRLLDPRLEMPFPKPCFAYGGLGDRHCSAQALSLTDGHNVTLLSASQDSLQLLLYNPRYTHATSASSRSSVWNVSDDSWVEVTRFASNCFEASNVFIGDGLLPLRNGASERKINGCWFFVGTGTGVFVNVRRVLRLPSRATMDKIVASWLHQGRPSSDQEWCSFALAKGYDSIVVATESDKLGHFKYIRHDSNHTGRGNAELIICYGGCAAQHVRSACPPVELRTGVDASRPCACDARHAILNCGNLRHVECRLPENLWNNYYKQAMEAKFNTSQAEMRPEYG